MELWWLWGYLIAMNWLAVTATIWDKRCARRGKRRVAEIRLWTLAVLGGALGMWCVMRRIRHKTRHASFMWGLPFVVLVQVAALVTFFTFLY